MDTFSLLIAIFNMVLGCILDPGGPFLEDISDDRLSGVGNHASGLREYAIGNWEYIHIVKYVNI